MLSFLAMVFTLRIGLGATPVDRAVVSLREEAVVVAARDADRRREIEWVGGHVRPAGRVELHLAPPSRRRMLGREEWRRLLHEIISNETVTGAAMWIASQPVHVSMKNDRFFVSLRFATP
jgi:hypothetical protein